MKFVEIRDFGKRVTVENGVIDSVSITNADHGCLSAWLSVSFHGSGCGFGGFALGKASGGNLTNVNAPYCAEWIVRCMNTVGVTEWESLKGKPIRCLHEGIGGQILAIGNFLKDEWFCPRIEFETK